MNTPLRTLRRNLARHGLLPTSRVARITAYLAGLDMLLFVLSRISAWLGSSLGDYLGGWISFLTFISAVLLMVLGLGWVRRRLMWRLRNRLIVTYVFIGVIPVLLLFSMGFIAAMLFAGQFAIYVANSDIASELKALESANAGMAVGIAARLQRREPATPEALQSFAATERMFPGREVTVWYRDRRIVAPAETGDEGVKIPPGAASEFGTVAEENGKLYLRALRAVPVGSEKLTVISSLPLTQEFLGTTFARFGRVRLAKGFRSVRQGDSSAQVAVQNSPASSSAPPQQASPAGKSAPQDVTIEGGSVPAPRNRFDYSIDFIGPLDLMNWKTGKTEPGSLGIVVSTRASVLYGRLASSFGENASIFISVLIGVAIALGVVELIALIIGARLTRTMTRSVAELYRATQHINRGDFRHRIKVKSQDQLAALETSFNAMTESLEKLIAEQKEKQRMENELAIAQEVQAQLFPRETSELASLEVHGVCQPARTVSGDYYDFLPLGAEKLAVAVGDISGKGISAALLMATIHSAVRAYSLERVPALAAASAGAPEVLSAVPFATADGELSPATLMAMLNRQLYASTPTEKYATLFLGIYDGHSRRLTYCNAGHLPPIIMAPDGAIRRLDCGGTVIGLFGGLTYEESTIDLRPGEVLIAYSDGITEPENDFGEFGEARLLQVVKENRDLPLARISEFVISTVKDWIGGNEQPDDITLVLARAR